MYPLDAWLIYDPEDRMHCPVCRSEDEAREIIGNMRGTDGVSVHRLADGLCVDVTVDFLPDDEEPSSEFDRASSRADLIHQNRMEA